MLPIIVLSALAVGASAFMIFDDDDDPSEEPESDGPYYVGGDDTIVADDDDNLFLRDPDAEDYNNVDIDAGAGDDTLALFDPVAEAETSPFDTTVHFDRAAIDAGAGDDLIDIVATSSDIRGGEGDDTISAYGFAGGTTIDGEAGDDVLFAEAFDGDSVVLDGGEGNDTIDVRAVNNGFANGGEGDDLIHVSGGYPSVGTGYVFRVDAGEGDDTINYEAGSYNDFINDFPVMLGGEGSDTFALRINEGDLVLPSQEDLVLQGSELISVEGGISQIQSVSLGDYDPETDIVEIDASSLSDTFDLTTARIETTDVSGEEGATYKSLVLRYVSEAGEIRDVSIGLGTGDITLDDVEFVGDEIPTLLTTT